MSNCQHLLYPILFRSPGIYRVWHNMFLYVQKNLILQMHTNTHQRNITYNNVLHVIWSEILLNRGFSYIPLYNSLARFSPRIHLCGAQFLYVKENEILRAPCHRYDSKYRIVMFRRNVTNIFYGVFFGHRLIKPHVRRIKVPFN